MSSDARILAGAMSGTSADGVDLALVEIAGRGLGMTARLIHHHHRTYDAALRRTIFSVREKGTADLATLAQLGREISLAYAQAVNDALREAELDARKLAAVAGHGQTLYHAPPDTIQWLDPALIAAEVGAPVVSDFRRADCAAGGQGAPLVPFADYILFRHPTISRVLLNIGGIANMTYLKAGGTLDDVIAFDTGPGNCISDYVTRRSDPAGPGFDEDATIARCGSVDPGMQVALREHPYFHRPPPKSTDVPEMITMFESATRSAQFALSPENLLATAAWLTGWSILQAVPAECELVASGGGTRNRFVMTMLERAGHGLKYSDELGVTSQAKEAIAFAILAAATLDGVPSNVPSATGAKKSVVLGSITPKP